MSFCEFLSEQMKIHPSFQPRDAVKQAYQAAYGAEHMISDPSAAERYFMEEYENTPADGAPLYERISENVYRVNISAWKQANMPPVWLARMFVLSSQIRGGGRQTFEAYLSEAEKFIFEGKTVISPDDWREFIAQYRKTEMGAVHHSAVYHNTEHPAYRVVRAEHIRLLPILRKIAERGDKYTVAAIDGRCASGKTTICAALEYILSAPAVHMDDFFVPPALRSDKRYAEAGGNVHYERFCEEVLPFITENVPFSYRIFDCDIMDYNESREIPAANVRIVEGSYSTHPKFGAYADVTVFSDVDAQEQMKRLAARNGDYAEMFRTKWIPLEEKYFSAFNVKGKCDIVV